MKTEQKYNVISIEHDADTNFRTATVEYVVGVDQTDGELTTLTLYELTKKGNTRAPREYTLNYALSVVERAKKDYGGTWAVVPAIQILGLTDKIPNVLND